MVANAFDVTIDRFLVLQIHNRTFPDGDDFYPASDNGILLTANKKYRLIIDKKHVRILLEYYAVKVVKPPLKKASVSEMLEINKVKKTVVLANR